MMSSMDSKNEPKYVMRLRQSHGTKINKSNGEKEKTWNGNFLSFEIPGYLKYKHDIAFVLKGRDINTLRHLESNNYLDIKLFNLKDVNKCREVLENPIQIYDDDGECYTVKVHIKFVMQSYVYKAKFGDRYDWERYDKLANKRQQLETEPRITLKFYFKDDNIDQEDVSTVIDYLYDQLIINKIEDVQFIPNYSSNNNVRVLIPTKIKSEVIQFMVNTFEVPGVGSITLGPKNVVLEEVNEEEINDTIENLDWKNTIKLNSIPTELADKYSKATQKKLISATKDFIVTRFKEQLKVIVIDMLKTTNEREYNKDKEEASIFEEQVWETTGFGFDRISAFMDKYKEEKISEMKDMIEKISKIFTSEEFKEGFKEVLNTLKNDNKEDNELQNMLEDVFKHINKSESESETILE